MIRIMFVCYGNICRSPMAEFIMKDLLEKKGDEANFYVQSSATHTDGLGCRVHRGTRAILDEMGISYAGKVGVQLSKSDYEKYDYFIGMDEMNVRDMLRIFGSDPQKKISMLLDYTDTARGVADPYWTGDFQATKDDVLKGVNGLYEYLKNIK